MKIQVLEESSIANFHSWSLITWDTINHGVKTKEGDLNAELKS